MEIAVFGAKTEQNLTSEQCRTLMSILPPARKKKFEQQSDKGKNETLWAYGLLAAAAKKCGIMNICSLEYDLRGKPFFSDCEWKMSISHTDGAALCALSRTDVGADIEKVRKVSSALMVRSGAATYNEFFEMWTKKESRVKCSGEGIYSTPAKTDEITEGKYFTPRLFDGYKAAVYTDDLTSEMTFEILTLDEILSEI